MRRVLLDTVTFIWAVKSPDRISRKAMAALESPGALRELSALSLSEIAIKQAKGKINFSRGAISIGLADLQIRVLPYMADHALRLFDLSLRHRDPFDRQIIAQALAEGLAVITPDEQFKIYREIKVIW